MRLSVVAFCLTTLLAGSTAFSLNPKSTSSKASVSKAHSRVLQAPIDCPSAASAFASCLEANGFYNANGEGNEDFNCNICDTSKDAFYWSCGGPSNSLLLAVATLFNLGVPNPASPAAIISRSIVDTVFDGVGSCPGVKLWCVHLAWLPICLRFARVFANI